MIQKSADVLEKMISRLKGTNPILKIGQNSWSLMKTFKKSSKTISEDNIKEADANFTTEVFDDTYLNMELALPRDKGETTFSCVTKSPKDANGLPIGTSHENPI